MPEPQHDLALAGDPQIPPTQPPEGLDLLFLSIKDYYSRVL